MADLSNTSQAQEFPEGHPLDTFKKENWELLKLIKTIEKFFKKIKAPDDLNLETYGIQLKAFFNNLMDVEKHYLRKEKLLFPLLEKYDITGPPGKIRDKHDETMELLSSSLEALSTAGRMEVKDFVGMIDRVLKPATDAISDMVKKEEEILFPMCLDKLTDRDWYEISVQSIDIGFCLYDPEVEWKPGGVDEISSSAGRAGIIQLPSGRLEADELINMLNTLPVEITFVDSHDKVRYFSRPAHQIFKRNRAILGRDVRLCHPPKSVYLVEQIVSDFKSGKQDQAAFWLEMNGRFIYIVYYAVRDESGKYLGTMEATQDVTDIRKLEGEQRLLNYTDKPAN